MHWILLEGTHTVQPDRFTMVVLFILIVILIMFSSRINKLDDAIQKLNDRLDNLGNTLVDISQRPCQMESHGFHVHVTRDENYDQG